MSLITKILRRNKVSTSVFPLETEEFSSPKPFSEVPGPKTVPILGSSWKYLPFIGSWDTNRLHQAGALKLAEFGHIVREEISSDLVLCHVFRADDIERVYKMEGRYPARRSHLALAHYRLTRPHIYNTGGLLPTLVFHVKGAGLNGSEWWRLRSAFQKHISPLHDVRIFLPTASDIIMEFIDKFIDDRTVIDDFLPLVSRLYLELMWMYMFGTRLRSFDSESMGTNSVPSKLIEAAETVNLSTMQTDSSERIWKVVKTPLYRQMESKLEYIERLVLDAMDEVVKKKEQCAADDINAPLIEKYFQNLMVDRKDINGMAVDLLLGSVDTTSYTTSFLLYNLSRSKTAQRRLRDEATGLLSMKDPTVTGGMLNKATYTRAILKESFRLNPISIGISRYLQSDTVFSGYLVPKGTLMMTQNLVACRNEKYFPSAEEFLPERWVRGSPHNSPTLSPFLVLPFSHGPRTCIARRLAEQNLLTLLLVIGRKFSVTWHGEALGIITPLICKPDSPVKLEFNLWKINS